MLPIVLKQLLVGHQVRTVQELGWAGIKNGELLKRANRDFEILLTADKNLRYQQNLKSMTLALIVFPSNRAGIVESLSERAAEMVRTIAAGEVVEL
jgi:hypothetical protein